ncbi:MAG TPA: DEAD/DEAH box helicase, partial [Acidobacteriota bacterium]|nr:DEAD/DEAH box helicase [Acidobacteriota bacterium]
MTFEQFGFNEQLYSQIKKAGFTEPTQIQAETIPLVLSGKDVIGQSKTGSGKTCAFALPILEKVTRDGLQAIILAPTRELCYQVADTFVEFGDSSGVKVVSVFGGVSIEPQIKQLERANICVATPGRMLDHMERGTIDLSQVRFVVLDEVDRMADMGFIDDVERIMSQMPTDRQTLLFSATMNDDVTRLASRYLKDPTQITAEIHVDRSKLTQLYYDIMPREKFSLLVHFLNKNMNGLSLVFCSTRHEADVVARNLAALDMPVKAIHGGLTQAKRSKALDMLKAEHISIL